MYLFRCLNPKCADSRDKIGHDFSAEIPTCPKCGLDGRDPRYRAFMQRLTVIHFDPPGDVIEGVGKNVTLCTGEFISHLGHKRPLEQATSDPGSVNCPACLEHADFPDPSAADPFAQPKPKPARKA